MRQTAFKSRDQILQLKDLFFNGDHQDQMRALALCRAYETRYHLPVSVHLTALLFSAIITDVPMNDFYAIRLGYSAALIRMVNELLDSAQSGKAAAPLHALAKFLNLPNTFVEVRHAATHETLPSISLLRELAQRAVGWLVENFWGHQTPHIAPAAEADPKVTFSAWRRSRRKQPTGPITAEEKQIIHTLREQCETNEQIFMGVLFGKNILIPSDLSTSSDFNRKADLAITLWGPALKELDGKFLETLVLQIIDKLDKNDWDAATTLSDKSHVYMVWLEYLVEQLHVESAVVLKQLSSKPRPWNCKGLLAYHKRFSSSLAYTRAQKMVKFTPGLPELPAPVVNETRPAKWKKAREWVPRPLGVE